MKLLLTILSITFIHGWEQRCKYDIKSRYSNSFDDPMKSYYRCAISDTRLIDENNQVTTNTANNRKSNDDVTMFLYEDDNEVKYIPNSIFTTFPNLEYFWINDDQKFVHLRPEYLKNSQNLKVFHVKNNDMTRLDANVFAEAINLEYINLYGNKIERINKSAFVGLPNLKGILLDHNRIKFVHEATFSHLTNLFVLELRENICVNKLFEHASTKFHNIENYIEISCEYPLSAEEKAEIDKVKEDECDMVRKLDQTIVKFTTIIEGLEQRIKLLEEKALENENKVAT